MPKSPEYPLADYLINVRNAADLLKDVVHIWQIGNEPNLYFEWGGDVLTAADYVDMFLPIRDALKSVSSPLGEQIVLLGPVSPGDVQAGVRHTAGNDYLGQMCDRLTTDDLDGFSLHAYAAPWSDAVTCRAELQAGYASQLAVIDSKGFQSLPAHITEWNRRVSNPSDPYYEAQSAQFLHGAFADLDAWNNSAGVHPISSACWFIYEDSPGWEQYSILHLRDIGPPGADNDLWDAFQYACTFDYPTAAPSGDGFPLMYDGVPPGVNVALAAADVTTDSYHDASSTGEKAIDGVIAADSKWASAGTSPPHWLQLDLGSARRLSGYVVHHAGAGGEPAYYNTEAFQLQWASSATGPWEIDATVFNGDSENSTFRRYVIPRITRYVRLFITDPGIDNWARIPEFEVYQADPGDFDQDGDVDLTDFARFQSCFTGEGTTQAEATCFFAHFDDDGDVDAGELADLLDALLGPQP
jgi:hypothetical protein